MSQPLTLPMLVRKLFCSEMHRRGNTTFGEKPMPHFDGGKDKYGTNRKSVWDEAARIIRANRLDPSLYVSMVFWNNLRLPSYNEINTNRVLERYQQYLARLPESLPASFKSGVATLSTLIKEFDVLQLDETTKIGMALQRYGATANNDLLYYCFAISAGRPDIAASVRHAAVAELALHPAAYLAAWPAGLIPSDIYTEAEQLRARFDAATRY